MKILHLIYDHINNPWVGGGGAVRAYEIYKRLSNKHHITVVCGKYPGANDYSEGNLRFHFVGTFRDNYVLSTFCYAFEAIRFLRKHRRDADIVIEDFAPYNPVFSRFIVSKSVVLQIHHKEGWNLFRRYFILGCPFMFMESFYPKLFKNIITVSEESKNKFKTAKAFVLPNGIDERLFNTSHAEGDYIAYIGRLHIHNKGLDTLINAMDLINARLLIGGRGKDEAKLKDFVKRSKGHERIELMGYLNEIKKAEFLANSQIVVIPSRYEGQGIVVLEAAACGKPVIVSDIPELRYAVNAGFGISFKTGDAKDLSQKINFLLENDSLRKEMGMKGKEYAKNFTWDRITEDYERYLVEVIEKRKHQSRK